MTPSLVSICICIISLILNAYHLLPDVEDRSSDMMAHLIAEMNQWVYDKGFCERASLDGIKQLAKQSLCEANALNGIQQLLQLNLSHPIKQGLSLIYFIRKSNFSQTPRFGSKQVEWLYHCCIGFKDIYLVKDWFIDTSYHCMTGNDERIIEKAEYLQSIPNTVDIFIIPYMKLNYFINAFRLRMPQINLNEFLESCKRPTLMWVFDERMAPAGSTDFEMVQYMLNYSVIFKCDVAQRICLPIGRFKAEWL